MFSSFLVHAKCLSFIFSFQWASFSLIFGKNGRNQLKKPTSDRSCFWVFGCPNYILFGTRDVSGRNDPSWMRRPRNWISFSKKRLFSKLMAKLLLDKTLKIISRCFVCSSSEEEATKMSSRNTFTNLNSPKREVIALWKVRGAPDKPKGILRNSKCPSKRLNAVLWTSIGLIGI